MQMMRVAAWLALVVVVCAIKAHAAEPRASAKQPNFVFILTDDQNSLLGDMEPMVKTRSLIAERGATFTHGNVVTPVCCPSRTTILSGRYPHNTLATPGEPYDCMHMNVTAPTFQQQTVAAYMSKLGYNSGMFGKYLNEHRVFCDANAKPIPQGWDRFFGLCTDGQYFNNTFNDDGVMRKVDGYETDVLQAASVEWIRGLAGDASAKPFFAMVAPHAPHIADSAYPYITQYAPKYQHMFANVTAPRTPNYGAHAAGHHPLLAQQQPLTEYVMNFTDELYRARWRSLVSVDDMVEALVSAVESLGPEVAANTYFVFTSDHGYNLGQFRLPSGKFNVYDNCLRVPFLIAGPGIPANVTRSEPVANVDIAATLYGLAGGNPDTDTPWDGRPIGTLFGIGGGAGSTSGASDNASTGSSTPKWRDALLVEYWSLGTVLRGAPTSEKCNPNEQVCLDNEAECMCDVRIHEEDGPGNTYIGLRLNNATHDLLYVEFYDDPNERAFEPSAAAFHEFYDVAADPWQMNNLYPTADKGLMQQLSARLHSEYGCRGSACA